MATPDFSKYAQLIDGIDPIQYMGVVKSVNELSVIAHGPQVRVGDLCSIRTGTTVIPAEAVALSEKLVTLIPFQSTRGICPGMEISSAGEPLKVQLSNELIGRVLDGFGRPIDSKSRIFSAESRSIYAKHLNPLRQPPIDQTIETGVRSIDSLLTVGRGQRVGVFSGTGVGKSTLLGMIGRHAKSDITVVALIGERNREIVDFIDNSLGEDGKKRSVVIAASSNRSSIERIKAAFVATTIAEYFRDQGAHVVLLMDSITRVARAQREVGLAAQEIPATRGYPPSVFQLVPEIVERAGMTEKGSITAFYTVLVEADDFQEPISDTVRGHLDGHIHLSRKIAHRGLYPSIDIPSSLSRVMDSIVSEEHKSKAREIRARIALYNENEDLIRVGAHVRGVDPNLDQAIDSMPSIHGFLSQNIDVSSSLEDSLGDLTKLVSGQQGKKKDIGTESIFNTAPPAESLSESKT